MAERSLTTASPSRPLYPLSGFVSCSIGAKPADLDAHLLKYKRGKRYHISYRYKTSWRRKAQLDRDDRDGFGPETITLRKVDPEAEYTYVVDDYTHHHRPGVANFEVGARPRVHGRSTQSPGSSTVWNGNLWSVFVLRQGKLKLVNKVSRSVKFRSELSARKCTRSARQRSPLSGLQRASLPTRLPPF